MVVSSFLRRLRIALVLLVVLAAGNVFAVSGPKDSIEISKWIDSSENCNVFEIPFYVQHALKKLSPYLATHKLSAPASRFYYKSLATCFNNLGFYFEHKGQNDKAIYYFSHAAFIQRNISDQKGLGITLSNLGSVHDNIGDIKQAISTYFESLRIREGIGDEAGIANILHNLSNIYYALGNLKEAERCTRLSLEKKSKLGDSVNMAYSYENLGIISNELRDTVHAIDYFSRASLCFSQQGAEFGRAYGEICLGRLGALTGNYRESKTHFENALHYFERQNQVIRAGVTLMRLAEVCMKMGDNTQALHYIERAKQNGLASNNLSLLSSTYRLFSQIAELNRNYNVAFEALKEHHRFKDSITARENQNTLLVNDLKYGFEKRAIQDSIKRENDLKVYAVKLENEQNKIYFGLVLLLISSTGAVLLYRRYLSIKKQNTIIEQQKRELLEQKQLADSRLVLSESQKQFIQTSLNKLEEVQEDLLASKLNAERLSKAKSDFISTTTHEIRTPLNAILGFGEILKSKEKSPEAQGYIRNILQAGRNLLNLVNNLLDLSKIEAGHLHIQHVETKLPVLLDECQHLFSRTAEEKNLYFRITCQEGIPESCLIDNIRLRQVLYNLLGNAFKFTRSGGVELFIHVLAQPDTEGVVDLQFKVSDTGIGIPEHQQQLIFEAFKQVEGQDVHLYGGTGLGLAICKQIVGALNGSISLESTPGLGSVFSVTLKRVKIIQPALINGSDKFDWSSKTLLLVESSGHTENPLAPLLHRLRCNVLQIEDLEESVHVVKILQPHLVLLHLREGHSFSLQYMEALRLEAKKTNSRIAVLSNLPLSTLELNFWQEAGSIISERQSDAELTAALQTILQPQSIASTPVNVNGLSQQWWQRWSSIRELKSIDEVTEFAQDLYIHSKNTSFSNGEAYASKLLQYAENFEMEALNSLMDEFESLFPNELLKHSAN